MKKFDKKSVKCFMAGVVTAALMGTTVFPAAAASVMQTIKVAMGGINIYVDGVKQEPKNEQGKTVEPLIYNGTTYLPVRALTNMLTDKAVNWDNQTRSIYIGTRPYTDANAVSLDQLELYNSSNYMTTGEQSKFTVRGKNYEPFNCIFAGPMIFKLDGKYTKLHAYLTSAGFNAGEEGYKHYVDFYNANDMDDPYDFYTAPLLKHCVVYNGDEPMEIEVDVTGCQRIDICTGNSAGYPALYNITVSP